MKQTNEKKLKAIARRNRILMSIMTFCLLLPSCGFYCQASADYGKAAGTWILDQLFWIGIVVLAIALMSCLLKKAWVAAVITTIAGGCILAVMQNPELIKRIGESIVHTVFG